MPFEWFKGILFENGRRYAKSDNTDTERPSRRGFKIISYMTVFNLNVN